jgi:pimeloyl-[acyl-carrier protein] methyl ester esterase
MPRSTPSPPACNPGTTLAAGRSAPRLALAIAARHPDKVGKLLLVAGTTSFVQRDGWPHAMPPAMLAEFTAGIAADVEAMLPRFVGGFNRGDARAKAVTPNCCNWPTRARRVTCWPPACAGCAMSTCAPAAQVACPTLLVHGAADPLMPLGAAEALAALIPGAQLAAFAECAHALPVPRRRFRGPGAQLPA